MNRTKKDRLRQKRLKLKRDEYKKLVRIDDRAYRLPGALR